MIQFALRRPETRQRVCDKEIIQMVCCAMAADRWWLAIPISENGFNECTKENPASVPANILFSFSIHLNIPTSCMEMSVWMVRLLPRRKRTRRRSTKNANCVRTIIHHSFGIRIDRLRPIYTRETVRHVRGVAPTSMFAYGRMRCNKNDASTIQINRLFDADWEGRQQLNQLRYSFRGRAVREWRVYGVRRGNGKKRCWRCHMQPPQNEVCAHSTLPRNLYLFSYSNLSSIKLNICAPFMIQAFLLWTSSSKSSSLAHVFRDDRWQPSGRIDCDFALISFSLSYMFDRCVPTK